MAVSKDAVFMMLMLLPIATQTCPIKEEVKGLVEAIRNHTDKIEKLLQNLTVKADSCGGAGCCPTGWVRYVHNEHAQSCYYIAKTPTYSWRKARKTCTNLGADLATIKSAEVNNFLFELVKKQNSLYGAWIGLKRETDQGFFWVEGTWVTDLYENWRDGKPNNEGDKEDCVNMWGPRHPEQPGTWNDLPCKLRNPLDDGETAPVAVCETLILSR